MQMLSAILLDLNKEITSITLECKYLEQNIEQKKKEIQAIKAKIESDRKEHSKNF